MVCPTDAVLLAFSSCHASRAALQFMHDMQSKAIWSWETGNSLALLAFGGVAFVDESVLLARPEHETETVTKDIKSIVLSLSLDDKQVHTVPLEDVFSYESEDKVTGLKGCVGMIDDEVGRDALMLAQAFTAEDCTKNSYTKIKLGDKRFWKSMSCAICQREDMLQIWGEATLYHLMSNMLIHGGVYLCFFHCMITLPKSLTCSVNLIGKMKLDSG